MEKQEMMGYLKARGMFERGMNQLVNWELAELVEKAMDAGVPTLDELKELENMDKPKAKPILMQKQINQTLLIQTQNSQIYILLSMLELKSNLQKSKYIEKYSFLVFKEFY